MLDTTSSIDGFPPEANTESMRETVAQVVSNVAKRKRMTIAKADIPQYLQALLLRTDQLSSVFRPASVEEAAAVVKYAYERGSSVSVMNIKNTGTHGHASGGAIVLDLSHANFQAVVADKEHMTVQISGGATSRLVDIELGKHDMVTPTVGYTVGLGAFLSGGFGFASRLYGLSSDNILEVQIILATGEVVLASDHHYPDLFWALKGCGTSFGVVTRITMKCYPLPRSLAANIIYPVSSTSTPALLRHWRDALANAPDETYSNFVLAAGPENSSGSVAIIQVCHMGSHATGMPVIQQLSGFTGEKHHYKEIDEVSYLRQQELVEAVLKGSASTTPQRPEEDARYLIDGCAVLELDDRLIDETCKSFISGAQPGAVWVLELFGGRLNTIQDSCIPPELRRCKFHAASIFKTPRFNSSPPADSDQAGREWIMNTIRSTEAYGPLPSFLPTRRTDTREAKQLHDSIRAAYGHDNWSRLKQIKVAYDSENTFDCAFDNGMLGYEEVLIDGV